MPCLESFFVENPKHMRDMRKDVSKFTTMIFDFMQLIDKNLNFSNYTQIRFNLIDMLGAALHQIVSVW